jgi:hypothetical protein
MSTDSKDRLSRGCRSGFRFTEVATMSLATLVTADTNSYEVVPFGQLAFAQTLPDRLATVARISGLTPPPVTPCVREMVRHMMRYHAGHFDQPPDGAQPPSAH